MLHERHNPDEPVSWRWGHVTDIDQELDAIEMTFRSAQMQRSATVVITSTHVHTKQVLPKNMEIWSIKRIRRVLN